MGESTGSENAATAQGTVDNNSNNAGSTAQKGDSGGNNAVNTENRQTDSNHNDLDRLIQSAVDRATNKLGNENKELKNQIRQLQTLNMTDAEKHEQELSEREKAVQEREKAVQVEKNRMYAVGAIKNAGLDDGSTAAMELIDLVMADDEKGIEKKVGSLKGLVDKLVQAAVNKTFTDNGRNPNKSGSGEDDPEKRKSEIGTKFGKRAAEANKRSRSVLDFYTGGKN